MGIRRFSSKLADLGIKGELLNLANICNLDTKRVIVVDILNFYYKSVRSKSLKSNYKPHLQGIYNLLSFLMKHGFIPISVFDGKPPTSKAHILRSRKAQFKQHLENAEKRSDYIQSDIEPTIINREQINELMGLLELLGLPYIKHDEYEAEYVCAWMIKEFKGHIYAALGDDWDLIVLGCPVLRNLNFKNGTVEYYNPSDICAKLGITHEVFVNFVMLLGTDYCDRIQGIETLELLNILKLNNGIIADAIEFILNHYLTGVRIPNVNYATVIKHFQIPDVNFKHYALNMIVIDKFMSYYMNPDFKGFMNREEFIKLRNKLIGILQIKEYIVSEKLEYIFPFRKYTRLEF